MPEQLVVIDRQIANYQSLIDLDGSQATSGRDDRPNLPKKS